MSRRIHKFKVLSNKRKTWYNANCLLTQLRLQTQNTKHQTLDEFGFLRIHHFLLFEIRPGYMKIISMHAKKLFILYTIFSIAFVWNCKSDSGSNTVENSGSSILVNLSRSVILFIGDGMGEAQRNAASFSLGDTLVMDDMPAYGFSRTNSADSDITDSAAAATAIATSVKTNNGIIGMDRNLNVLRTILEEAHIRGMSTGLITNVQITHATPAAFAAHVEDRDMMTEIAKQMLDAGVDVLLGGGEDYFIPISESGCYPQPGKRSDGRNLINEAIASGYTYVCKAASFNNLDPSTTERLMGLFADEGMSRPFTPTLEEMTQKSIEILSKNPNGFFLMVEGGQIDWAAHSNDADDVISDVIGLDQAVAVAKQFGVIDNDTLIIVTADHETGGMSVDLTSSGLPGEDGPFFMPDGTPFYVNWSTSDHTNINVPTSAQGQFSEMLNGVHDNTHIYTVMVQ